MLLVDNAPQPGLPLSGDAPSSARNFRVTVGSSEGEGHVALNTTTFSFACSPPHPSVSVVTAFTLSSLASV